MKRHTQWKEVQTALGVAMAACVLAVGTAGIAAEPSDTAAEISRLTAHIHWLGHDGFRIDGDGVVIYIDPYKISGGPKADLILITHDHADHASPEDVAKIQQEGTIIVTVPAAAKKFSGHIQTVKPGDRVTVKGIPIEAVPAYNINKFRSPGVPFHPRDAGYVGFVITVNGVRIYHAGDTDAIPEMKDISCDVALLPVSGIYVMTAEEAAEAARMIHPKVAIPMHVGKGIGSLDDAQRFKKLSPVPVVILPME